MRTTTRLTIVLVLLVAATTLIIGIWGLFALQRSGEAAVIEAQSQVARIEQTALIRLFPALAAVGLLVAFAAFYFDRQFSRPIRRLTEGTIRAAASGDHLADLPQRGDEIGDLALAINTMSTRLTSSSARIEERTAELNETAAQLAESARRNQRCTFRLEAYAHVAKEVASTLNPDRLLEEVVHRLSEHFRCYHTGVFLVDESGLWAVLHATNSAGGQSMLARGHRLGVGTQSIVGTVTRTGKLHVVHDVAGDTLYEKNHELPHTQSEITLPLVARGRVLGALDVQSTETSAFDDDDVLILSILADQTAFALDNARQFQESQAAIAQLQAMQHQYTSDVWDQYVGHNESGFYEYRQGTLTANGDESLAITEAVLNDGVTTATTGDNGNAAALVAPIRVRGTVIGALGLQEEVAGGRRVWSDDDISLVETVADQVGQALETARLYHQARQRAGREQLVTEIAGRIRSAPDIDGILRTAVTEIRRTLGVSHGAILLGTEAHLQPPKEENDGRLMGSEGEGTND
jgi:GAF domain-containing protein/HAMP domain-containing protein